MQNCIKGQSVRKVESPCLREMRLSEVCGTLTLTDSAILLALEVFFLSYLKELNFFSKYLVLMNVFLFCFGLLAVNVCEDNKFYRLLYILSAY